MRGWGVARWVALGVLAALIAGAAGCGGARPVWPADAGAKTYTVPLVIAWRPARLLVEGSVDGVGPMLLVVDTGAARSRLRRDVVEQLGLPSVGDPMRGRRVRAERLALGELALRGVTFAVAREGLGELYGRPVMGVLGVDVFAGRRLEYDREAGLLRVPPAGAPTPPAAVGVGVARDGPPRVAVEVAGVPLDLRFHSGMAGSTLHPSSAQRVADALGEGGGGEPVLTVAGLAAGEGAWRVERGVTRDGVLGLSGLAGLSWRLDLAEGRFSAWRAGEGARRFERFEGLPCTVECVRPTIAAVESGRVTLSIEGAASALPPGYALRVDLGRPGRPFGALLQHRARVEGGDAPATTTLFDASIEPGVIRAVGQPIEVLDVVVVDHVCKGLVCLERQVGDSADTFVESSPPAGGSVDPDPGVAPAR